MWTLIVQFLSQISKFIKDNWSGIAISFFNFEEKRVDSANQKTKTESLKVEQLKNEIQVSKDFQGLSDTDVIEKLGDDGTDSGSGKPPKA